MTKRELGIGVTGLFVGFLVGLASKDEPKNITPRLSPAIKDNEYIDIDAAFKEVGKESLFSKASRVTDNASQIISSKETKDVIKSGKELLDNLDMFANMYNEYFGPDKK